MAGYEKDLLALVSADHLQLNNLLQFEPPREDLIPTTASNTDHASLVDLIGSYRLIDVALNLQEGDTLHKIPLHRRHATVQTRFRVIYIGHHFFFIKLLILLRDSRRWRI